MKGTGILDYSNIPLLVIVVLIVVLGIFLHSNLRVDGIQEAVKTEKMLAVLVTITDQEKPVVTELLLYHPKTNRAGLFHIPGETGSIIERFKRIDRIDILYDERDVSVYLKEIGHLTGITIPYYVSLSLETMEKLIDLMRGLRVFVSHPIEDVQGMEITLIPSGNILLDGRKARSYIEKTRTEKEGEGIVRAQKFVMALLEGLGSLNPILSQRKVYGYLQTLLLTNVEGRALRTLIRELGHLDANQIVYRQVRGVKRRVDAQEILFPHYEGRLLKETIKQIEDALATAESGGSFMGTYPMAILNGTKRNGLAKRAAQLYENFGFNVVFIGNAERQDYTETAIFDRKGETEAAAKVASIIRCRTILSGKGNKTADVTIILGSDFDGRYVKN